MLFYYTDESKFNAEIIRVIDNFNGEKDIVMVKMIVIGIVVGFMSVKKSYALKILKWTCILEFI